MPIVFTETTEDGRERIRLTHYKPERLSEERRAQGVEVDAEALRKPETASNERAKAYLTEAGDVEWRIEKRPDPEGLMAAIDRELGRKVARKILREYPDVERALERGYIARAWAGLDDAREDGAIDAETLDTIERLAEEYGIPKPERKPEGE